MSGRARGRPCPPRSARLARVTRAPRATAERARKSRYEYLALASSRAASERGHGEARTGDLPSRALIRALASPGRFLTARAAAMGIDGTPRVWPTSCDTFVAVQGSKTLLGKNSDRPAFDCQPLRFHGAQQHGFGATIQLEYREIPQAPETLQTHATCGTSPYWCWGYEMGMNDCGVAIGNEAIFTKELARTVALHKAAVAGRGQPVPLGVSGMSVLRIGLERGATAKAALDAMVAIIEEYGQWGSAVPGMDHIAGSYDNSFLIADAAEAWVLETAGKHWIAKRVPAETTAAISNEPTIRTEWDCCSDGLVQVRSFSHSLTLSLSHSDSDSFTLCLSLARH